MELRTLSIDIGGSGLKALVLDPAGVPVSDRVRLKTPEVPTRDAVVEALRQLAGSLGGFDRVSIGFPGVIVDGEIRTAVNLHPELVGLNLAAEMEKLTGKPTRVANDADVQGLGAIEGKGVEMVITLGTGMGSALFVEGHLVPNLELGHHPFRKGRTYEEYLGEAGFRERGPEKWNQRLEEAVGLLGRIFNYRTLYLGGGNAKRISFTPPESVRVIPNLSGLLGGIRLWEQ